LGLISISSSSGWNPLDNVKNQMTSVSEISAGTVGLLTWTSAFNTIFNSFLLRRLNDLDRKTSIANRLQQLHKWRSDHELIQRHIDQGFKIVMTPNQMFYIGHLYEDSTILARAMHAYEKVFICAGKYHLVGPIDLTITQEIIAEPGTEIVVDLNDSNNALFMAGETPSEVSNLTFQMSYPTRRYKELCRFIKRVWKREPMWEPTLSDEKNKVIAKRVSVKAGKYTHVLPGVASLTVCYGLVKTIITLKKWGYNAPKLVLATLLSTGLLSGFTFGIYHSDSGNAEFLYDSGSYGTCTAKQRRTLFEKYTS